MEGIVETDVLLYNIEDACENIDYVVIMSLLNSYFETISQTYSSYCPD